MRNVLGQVVRMATGADVLLLSNKGPLWTL
jgi:hypothetical protein